MAYTGSRSYNVASAGRFMDLMDSLTGNGMPGPFFLTRGPWKQITFIKPIKSAELAA